MNGKAIVVAALIATISVLPGLAQSNNRINVLGTVEMFNADALSVETDGGKEQTFKLSPNLLVVQDRRATLADIKPSDFIASAAVHKQDGKLHSTELRIFPDALRGQGEGQRLMNDAQNQTMTNATVTGAAIVNGSNNLTVKFQGGDSELVVDPGVPVIRIDVVDKDMLKSGVKVRVQGVEDKDGAIARVITVR